MPLVELAAPTQVLLEWGWLLVTRANGLIYLLIIVMLILGMTLRLPRARRDMNAVAGPPAGTATSAADEESV